jgi:hypothetical protein
MLSILRQCLTRLLSFFALSGGIGVALLAASGAAHAVPSFSRQTGSECAACHMGSYGLNLTPYGIRFKAGGYVDSDGKGLKIPLAVQLIGENVNPKTGSTRTRLSEADLYVAGKFADQVGGMARVSRRDDGSTVNTTFENLDLRFVQDLKVTDKDTLVGVSLNNSPGVQDPIAILPARGFSVPSTDGTLLNPASTRRLANRVLGTSVYALHDGSWYGELGTYRAMSVSAQDRLGFDPADDPGKLSGTSYWRLAYMKDLKTQFFSAGLVGLNTKRQLNRSGPGDDIKDLGVDLSYQYLGSREHMVQLRYFNILERRKYGTTPASPFVPGLVANSTGRSRDQSLSMTYVYQQSYDITVARLVGTAADDAVRYLPYGRPDTTSTLILVSWVPFGKEDSWATPWANVRLSAGWFKFSKFNGSATDIFGTNAGSGAPLTNAKDLNQFSLSLRTAF